jgi:hypothetical protein
MDLKEIQNQIRTLAVMKETDSVVISCYLNLQKGGVANRNFFQNRVGLLRKILTKSQSNGFEEAIARICDYLDKELIPEFGGTAVFARGGEEPFFLPLQFQVPLPDWIAVGAFPNVFHLVELKDTYHRFVILISTEEKARIIEVTLGEVTQELWGEHPELQERIGRGWSKEQYQRHRLHHTERFIKEKIEILEKLMAKGGHKHFILAGNPRRTSQIVRSLPRHLAEKLVDTVQISDGDQLSDIVKMAVTMFVEVEEQESRAVVERLMDEIHTNCLGVAGISDTLRALQCGSVDILVIAKDFEAEPGWRCGNCRYVGEKYGQSANCSECGAKETEETELREEMIRLAEKYGCQVEVVNHSDRLMQFQGIGALLRYYAAEQY